VRLSGDPRAARELARLCHRFLGPLPAMVAFRPAPSEPFWASPARPVPGVASVSGPARVLGTAPDSEELDFLSAFEGRPATASEPSDQQVPHLRLEDIVETSRARSSARRKSRSARGAGHPLDRRALTLATVVLAAVAALALGSRWFAPLFAGWFGDGGSALYERSSSPIASGEPGTVIPLTGPGAPTLDSTATDSAASSQAADSAGETDPAAAAPGAPAPWSVHVGSYRSVVAARGVASDLARRGMTAFLSPVVLPEKGEWVRVYVGAFDDPEEARATLSELTTSGIVEDGSVRDTPLAFLLGVYPTTEEARGRISELAGRGIPAYALGEGPVRVWAGAFQNEAESRLLASTLGAEGSGEPITLSKRER
jgi:cell division septation protein DedD